MATLRGAVVAQLIRVGRDVLSSELSPGTNSILVQVGDATNSAAESDQAQWMGQLGVWARPASPAAGAAGCQVVELVSSDRDYVIGSRDTRANKIPGALSPGDTVIGCTNPNAPIKMAFAANGAATITPQTGSPTIFTGSGSCSLCGNSGGAVALATKIDALITLLTAGTYTPSGTETGFASLLSALVTYKGNFWTTNATTGSSKVSAGL